MGHCEQLAGYVCSQLKEGWHLQHLASEKALPDSFIGSAGYVSNTAKIANTDRLRCTVEYEQPTLLLRPVGTIGMGFTAWIKWHTSILQQYLGKFQQAIFLTSAEREGASRCKHSSANLTK